MVSWLKERVKYEEITTRNDILDDMFGNLLSFLRSTELIQTCDNNSLRVCFIAYIHKYYYRNDSLKVNYDENYEWIDQLYSQELSEIFAGFLETDDYYLTEIFKYRTFDKLLDFISQHFIYDNQGEAEDLTENNFYQTIDERYI